MAVDVGRFLEGGVCPLQCVLALELLGVGTRCEFTPKRHFLGKEPPLLKGPGLGKRRGHGRGRERFLSSPSRAHLMNVMLSLMAFHHNASLTLSPKRYSACVSFQCRLPGNCVAVCSPHFLSGNPRMILAQK